jgi:hypothetical protein
MARTTPDSRVVSGFRVSSVLRTYYLGGNLVTRKHLYAADRFLRAYELGDIGRSPSPDPLPIESSEGTRAKALRDFQTAKNAIGPSPFGIIQAVVLNNQHAGTYARQRGMNRHVAMGYLVASLDRLWDHYAHEFRKSQRTAVFLPPAHARTAKFLEYKSCRLQKELDKGAP